jgi:hypothetical protein
MKDTHISLGYVLCQASHDHFVVGFVAVVLAAVALVAFVVGRAVLSVVASAIVASAIQSTFNAIECKFQVPVPSITISVAIPPIVVLVSV